MIHKGILLNHIHKQEHFMQSLLQPGKFVLFPESSLFTFRFAFE